MYTLMKFQGGRKLRRLIRGYSPPDILNLYNRAFLGKPFNLRNKNCAVSNSATERLTV